MATPVDPQMPEASRQKKGHVRFVDVSPRDEDQGSSQDPHQSVWAASLFLGKCRLAHRRGARTQHYPECRQVLKDQELQLRATVPLPLGAAMNKETLHILLDVEKTYSRHLGPDHALTADARRRIQMLRDRTSAQSVREEPKTSAWRRVWRNVWSRWRNFWRSVWSRWRSAGRRAQIQNIP